MVLTMATVKQHGRGIIACRLNEAAEARRRGDRYEAWRSALLVRNLWSQNKYLRPLPA